MLNPVYLKRQPEQPNSGTDPKIPSGIIGKPFSSEFGKASSDITIGNFAVEMIRDMDVQGTALFEADRGYGSLNLIETIRRKEGLECLIRVKESWINETKNLPLENLDIDITIHVVTTQRKEDKVRFKNGEAKYLSGKSKFGKNKTSQTWDYESELPVTNLKLKKMANRTFAYPSAIFLGCSTVFLALFPLKKQVLRLST